MVIGPLQMSKVGLPERRVGATSIGSSVVKTTESSARRRRHVKFLGLRIAAIAAIAVLPTGVQSGDANLHLVGLDLGVPAVESQALSDVRAHGIESSVSTSSAEQDFAVILWDERKLGGIGAQPPIQLGPVNSNTTGSNTRVDVSH